MALVQIQNEFAGHAALLIQEVQKRGFYCTFGDAYRAPQFQQWYLDHGYSNAEHSQHSKRLAIDLNLFTESGEWITTVLMGTDLWVRLQLLGAWWKHLHPANRWGGDWLELQDYGHFERRE